MTRIQHSFLLGKQNELNWLSSLIILITSEKMMTFGRNKIESESFPRIKLNITINRSQKRRGGSLLITQHRMANAVFTRRQILIHLLWLVLLFTLGGHYVSMAYGAINKYYDRPIITVVSRKHLKQMAFPAVMICSFNMFAKSKIFDWWQPSLCIQRHKCQFMRCDCRRLRDLPGAAVVDGLSAFQLLSTRACKLSNFTSQ